MKIYKSEVCLKKFSIDELWVIDLIREMEWVKCPDCAKQVQVKPLFIISQGAIYWYLNDVSLKKLAFFFVICIGQE